MTGVTGRFGLDEEVEGPQGTLWRGDKGVGELRNLPQVRISPGFYFQAPLSNKCLFQGGGSAVTLSFSLRDWPHYRVWIIPSVLPV